jgi:DNA-binding MarR family transcriptional regulator
MNVNNAAPHGTEHYRSLQILDELSNNDSLTQRDLSSRLGIALGLVNSYIKNLIKKGYITVKTIPSKRYAYYLTPKGFTEKTRLTYDLLHDYTRIYREARSNLKKLFHDLENNGAKKIVFAGADEVAEIAYITLHETTLELAGVVDDDKAGDMFFPLAIKPINDAVTIDHDIIVITSYVNRKKIYQALLDMNIDKKSIHMLFADTT